MTRLLPRPKFRWDDTEDGDCHQQSVMWISTQERDIESRVASRVVLMMTRQWQLMHWLASSISE